MRTTITHTIDLELEAEFDADYWRNEDEKIQDLTLCALYAYEPRPGTARHDLLLGLDRPSRLIVERNLLKLAGMSKRLCDDFEALGDDMHLETEQDPQDY